MPRLSNQHIKSTINVDICIIFQSLQEMLEGLWSAMMKLTDLCSAVSCPGVWAAVEMDIMVSTLKWHSSNNGLMK